MLHDLIQITGCETEISHIEATNIVTMVIEEIARSLEKGDRVEIRGVCTFSSKAKYSRY